MVEYLTADELVAINAGVAALSGDPHGVLSEANLRHAVEAIQYKYEGEPEAVLLKAAFLLDYLANKGHVFIEGNKRTAETATIAFLRLNGYYFREEDQKALTQFVLGVAKSGVSLSTIKKWLEERVKKALPPTKE